MQKWQHTLAVIYIKTMFIFVVYKSPVSV